MPDSVKLVQANKGRVKPVDDEGEDEDEGEELTDEELEQLLASVDDEEGGEEAGDRDAEDDKPTGPGEKPIEYVSYFFADEANFEGWKPEDLTVLARAAKAEIEQRELRDKLPADSVKRIDEWAAKELPEGFDTEGAEREADADIGPTASKPKGGAYRATVQAEAGD